MNRPVKRGRPETQKPKRVDPDLRIVIDLEAGIVRLQQDERSVSFSWQPFFWEQLANGDPSVERRTVHREERYLKKALVELGLDPATEIIPRKRQGQPYEILAKVEVKKAKKSKRKG
ncbi:MAG: hypothetical protein HY791_14605 [Deltaproteobacteria bacterium]|nr:hypothetical protein [Deltaproteobacteria bacterium]